MNFSENMDLARVKALEQGIQQTNRYQILYPKFGSSLLYPYSITLPGFGYDLVEHSIWAVPRKIPFRRTHTDLEVTFITGKKNYSNMINIWNRLMTSPRFIGSGNGGAILGKGASNSFAQANGVSPSATENGGPPTPREQPIDSEGNPTEFGTGFFDKLPILADYTHNLNSENIDGRIPGNGGALNFSTITNDYLILNLLNEKDNSVNTQIEFHEVYVSQVSQVQLTSVDTGYSPFKVFFKFTSCVTYNTSQAPQNTPSGYDGNWGSTPGSR